MWHMINFCQFDKGAVIDSSVLDFQAAGTGKCQMYNYAAGTSIGIYTACVVQLQNNSHSLCKLATH